MINELLVPFISPSDSGQEALESKGKIHVSNQRIESTKKKSNTPSACACHCCSCTTKKKEENLSFNIRGDVNSLQTRTVKTFPFIPRWKNFFPPFFFLSFQKVLFCVN